MERRVVTDYTDVAVDNANLKVYVRARPPDDGQPAADFLQVEQEQNKRLTFRDPNSTTKNHGEHAFLFDRIFWTDAQQDEVFNTVCKPQVHHVLNGYNACCFAYGQTGSGKTYSMFGGEGEIRGLIPRCVEYLFQKLAERSSAYEVALVCSFLEIYCDEIRDLGKAYSVSIGSDPGKDIVGDKTSELFDRQRKARQTPFNRPTFSRPASFQSTNVLPEVVKVIDEYSTMNYEIYEDADGTVFVKDLALIPVTTLDEVMALINLGLRVRATHETKMNSVSSRSHTVFTITIVQRDRSTGQATSAMLHLVDLAGSERLKKSESQGARLREALHINTSLTALGKVVTALDPAASRTHVPYRDSKLTRLLQNSLGGNSYTTVLATIHPSLPYADECMGTLQFANRCRNVRNNPRVNYVASTEADKDKRIKRLLEEIAALRAKIAQLEGGGGGFGGGGMGSPQQQQAQIVQILQQLGIEASATEEGEIRLSDGTVLDMGVSSPFSARPLERMSYTIGPGARGVNAREVQELKRELKMAEEEQKALKTKLHERKEMIDKLEQESKEMQTAHLQAHSAWRKREQELQAELTKTILIREQLSNALAFEHRDQLHQLLGHNTSLLAQQHSLLNSVPSTLQVQSELLNEARDAERTARQRANKEHQKQIEALEAGREAQVAMLKQQYEYWMGEKDKRLQQFVEELNEYRAKKEQQLKQCDEELLRLYDFASALESILQKMEKGQLPIQSRGSSGIATIVVPKQMRPVNILADVHKLENTHRALQQRSGAEDVAQLLHNTLASKAGETGDEELQSAIEHLLRPPNGTVNGHTRQSLASSGTCRPPRSARTQKRPFSAPRSRTFETPGRRFSHTPETTANGICLDGTYSEDRLDDELVLPAAGRQRAHSEEQALTKAQLREEILAELATHPTVEYIRYLEDQRNKLRAQVREDKKALQNMKIANAALQRQLEGASAAATQTTMPHAWQATNGSSLPSYAVPFR